MRRERDPGQHLVDSEIDRQTCIGRCLLRRLTDDTSRQGGVDRARPGNGGTPPAKGSDVERNGRPVQLNCALDRFGR
jgi:hypothetical protein